MSILAKRLSLHCQTELVTRKNKQLQKRIQHLEKISVLGKSWAMVAHEINNILTLLTNYAQLALMNPNDPELTQKALEKAIQLGNQASEILDQVLLLSGQQETRKIPYSIKQLIADLFSTIARDLHKDKISVSTDIPEELIAHMDPIGIRQVLLNLLLNAREAMLPRGGRLEITAKSNPHGVQICISDTGCGMTAEQIDHIFDPFFTTKDGHNGQRKGNGIGLSFCKQILDNHGGSIWVESRSGQGTVFTIQLPHVA